MLHFPCQYHSTIATLPLSVPFNHCYISPVSTIKPSLISPVSTIPPLLHFPCQYHSTIAIFPLSVPFNHCYISPVSTILLLLHFPCQYHSTIAPYSSIHLPPTLYNVFLPALQFSPVSTIPPLLHTDPSIYHRHCTMFLSQHFYFPCQYHSTIATFPQAVPFHHCYISPVSTIPTLLHFPCQYHSNIATQPHMHINTTRM